MVDATDVEASVLDRERERRAALVADDMSSLAEILAEDLIHVHTTGIVHGKAELLQHAGSFLQFYAVDRGPLIIRLIGPDAAVMTGTMTNTVGRRGEPERVQVEAFVTQLWARRSGHWQLASFHATRIPEQAK